MIIFFHFLKLEAKRVTLTINEINDVNLRNLRGDLIETIKSNTVPAVLSASDR